MTLPNTVTVCMVEHTDWSVDSEGDEFAIYYPYPAFVTTDPAIISAHLAASPDHTVMELPVKREG